MSNPVVPENYTELFEEYFPLIKYLVRRAHIRPENVEDYAMELIVRLIDKDILGQYDPEHPSSANIKTFLSNWCNSYLRHFAERDRINAYRSRISTDMKLGKNNDTPFEEYFGIVAEDNTAEVELSQAVSLVRAEILEAADEKLLAFYDAVVIQVEQYGKVDVAELAEKFGVARQTIFNRLKKLRKVFDLCL